MHNKDTKTIGNIYRTIITESAPRDWSMDVPSGEGIEDEIPSEELMQHSISPAKFPGVEGLKASKFYLPYLKHFKDTYGEMEGAAFGEMIARIAQEKLKNVGDGKFTGTEVEFRQAFLSPLIRNIINEFGVTKGVSELTSGYVARALTDAFIDAGYLKGDRLEKPEPVEDVVVDELPNPDLQ